MRLWKSARVDEPARGRGSGRGSGRGGGHDEMRERVGRAVEAARMAQAGVPGGLGSASMDVVIARRLETAERAAVTGPVEKARRRGRRGLAPELVWATARAAQEAGRRPEEVWAEALRDWLVSRQLSTGASVVSPIVETRRQRCWREIETTLQALRTS